MEKCIICRRDGLEKTGVRPISVYDKRPYAILRCRNCGALFTDPIPSQSEVGRIYKENYFYGAHSLTLGEKKYRSGKIAEFIGKFEGINTALDVGAMYGFLVRALNERGIDCRGIEMDSAAAEIARKSGNPVDDISLEDFLEKPGKNFDLIVLSHVLEHLMDPKEKILMLRERLNRNGKLFIAVPNAQSCTRKLCGRFWGYWDVPVHVTHFGQNSLRFLLESSGFEVLEMEKAGGSSLLFFSTLAKMAGKSGATVRQTSLRKWLIRTASSILKYWYNIGNDEIMVMAVARK